MRLLRCHIENFGVLSGFDYEFPEGLAVICRENGFGKSYVIVTFLGILEMMKTGKFTIEQDKLFDDIIITYNPGKEQEEEQ